MVTNAERNRAEIASLRHEISSLLQTNGQLHQHLGQLNSFLPDSSVAANSQGGASAEANLRRSWDNSEAPRPCGHMRSDPGASCLSSPRGAAALASLLRERDDLQQRLQATELARCAAQQRRATAEAALRRCTEDLEWQRKRIAAQEAGEDQPFGEAELLRKQLREAQDKIAELDVILSARSERVRANERDYAEARVEFDALSVANDAIQKELEATRSRIASEQQGCQAAESELSEFQARMRAEEVEFAAEVETLGSRRSSLETSLRESSANLADMEAEVSAARAQSLGLRAQLEVLQAARDEIVSQEHQATVQQRAEVERLEAKAESLAAEALDLSHRHEQAKVSFQEVQESQTQKGNESKPVDEDALSSARLAAAERCRRARDEVAEAEQRLGERLRRLGAVRQQKLQLARELASVRESGTSVRKPVRRAKSAGSRRGERAEVPTTKSSQEPDGWASSAFQMQQELELLQRWKADALNVLEQMQADVASAQEKYHQQLKHNQMLQGRLERMGLEAKAVLTELPRYQTPGALHDSCGGPAEAVGGRLRLVPEVPERSTLASSHGW